MYIVSDYLTNGLISRNVSGSADGFIAYGVISNGFIVNSRIGTVGKLSVNGGTPISQTQSLDVANLTKSVALSRVVSEYLPS